MDNVPRPRYSIRDHVVQHEELVPALINAFAVQMMGITLTAAAQQAHRAGMKVGAQAAVCRAYDYLQTALNIVSSSPGRKNDSIKNEFRNDIGSSLKSRIVQVGDPVTKSVTAEMRDRRQLGFTTASTGSQELGIP